MRIISQEIFDESSLLKPDEIDIRFNNTDMFSISNVGVVDGLLHIQAKIEVSGVALTDGHYINTKFVNSEGAVVYNPMNRIDFIADKEYDYLKSHNEYNDLIFKDITDAAQLEGLTLAIDYMKSPQITEGDWAFSFAIPEKVTTEFKIDREIEINGNKINIDMISLSPLGVTVHLPEDLSEDYAHNDIVLVEYKDGMMLALDQSAIHTYEDVSTLVFGGQIIEIEKAQSVFINSEKINIAQ
jgi:hypothetical protein